MSTVPQAGGAAAPKERTLFGHPIGLYVLFFTEMWERFSYYGMRALLMLYMVNYFRWTQREASGIYKWYTSLVYLTPLIGGFLADRYLGNRRAVIIGAILMAIGHFLMVFEELSIFYSALGFLIIGNGFFKPNISTQVGRLYPANDSRRDGAYTIFYMGINLGAFLAPLVCGWLADRTAMSYHAGFTAAGVGMVIGLLIYIFGMPLVKELIPEGIGAAPSVQQGAPLANQTNEVIDEFEPGAKAGASEAGVQPFRAPPVRTELEAENVPSALPTVNRLAGIVLVALGVMVAIAGPVLWLLGIRTVFDFVFMELIAISAFLAAWILSGVRNAVRDRVIAIYALAVFVVFFWCGFEQAGNVLNIWADQSTNRYLWTEPNPPTLRPTDKEVQAEGWFAGLFNPIPTAWFQSINALAIVIFAPLVAWLWTTLDRRGILLTIPLKMALGIFLLSLSFALMVGAARSEDQESRIALEALPEGIVLNSEAQLSRREESGGAGETFFAGRLKFDAKAKALVLRGALPIVERDRILAETAPPEFVEQVAKLKKASEKATKDEPVVFKVDQLPSNMDWSYTKFVDARTGEAYLIFNPTDNSFKIMQELAGKDTLALQVAASDPSFRDVLNRLVVESSSARVSWSWLFWAYILATFGELCLSPVGLSMVSKLAPAKYATMLMGMWLLTNAFAQFLGGELGEHYGEWTPTFYFLIFFIGTLVASLILFALLRVIGALMHGVR